MLKSQARHMTPHHLARRRKPRSGYQITTHMAVAFLLLFLFVGSAYLFVLSDSNSVKEQRQLLDELTANEERWANSRPAAFEYVVVRDCECSSDVRAPYNVREQRGSREARYAINIESTSGESLSEPVSPVWLDDFFIIAQEAIVENKNVSLRFDGRYGFVSALTIHTDDEPAARYVIRDFENSSPRTP